MPPREVQSDPSFMKKFIKPPEYNCIATYDGHADNVECVRPQDLSMKNNHFSWFLDERVP